MLSEEALVVLAAVGACALLLLGVLELLWPTRPKHPVRRNRPTPTRVLQQRPHRTSALVRHSRDRAREPYPRRASDAEPAAPTPLRFAPPVEPPQPEVAETPLVVEPVAVVSEPAAVAEEPLPLVVEPAPLTLEPVPLVLEPVSVAPEPPLVESEAAEPITAESLLLQGSDSVVETCFALYQQQRYDELIELGGAALGEAPGPRRPVDAQETAALWSVVALARQARGEDMEARAALEAAIAVAPEGDRATYQRQLAALAESVAQGLLAEAQRHPNPESEDCLDAVRSATAWLERGAAAAPGDAALAELVKGAQVMLWPAYERTVMAMAQRQDFRGARRLLREALADPRFPEPRTEAFKELFSGTFSGEIGQLTAQAIRSMQDAREADALGALQRAETLLDTLNDEALSPKRREEVDRRLWWGYNKLGTRRVEAGEHDAALEPLFHALGYEVGPERLQETRALLVRALAGVVDAQALEIREVADAGDREAALVQCDKLWTRLRSATGMGLRQADLAGAFATVQRLFESLGRPEPAP